MRIQPRLLGRRLHTDGVIAGYWCNGSPKRSSDSGCTCHSMLADGCAGSLFANAPSCEGGMVSGPVRKSRYSRPIAALPNSELARSFRVVTPCTLYTVRICRWSCRFSPTPGSSWMTAMPCSRSSGAGPTPDSCRSCGEPIAPAASTTSPFATTSAVDPSSNRSTTPVARLTPSLLSIVTRCTCALVTISRFVRCCTGRRNALVALQRTPRF